jgi:hypothetical protein
VEFLTQQVAEKSHRITQLEKELAIEKARSEQLFSFLKQSGISLGGQNPAW